LVLEGPSRFGKNIFALKIAGRTQTLDLSCAGQLHPELRNHNPFIHKAVLFDEAPVDMILAYKRHLQAPSTLLDCGTSATNNWSHKVWLHRQMLIVTSNTWSQELDKISPLDRDWIETNSVHVLVIYQMWVDEPRVCATPGKKEYPPADKDLADFLRPCEVATAPVDDFDDEDVFDFGCSNFDS